jgi:hypothetical protein
MKRKVALAKLSLVLSRLLTEGGFIFAEDINIKMPSSSDVLSLSLPQFWWAVFMASHCCDVQPGGNCTLLAMEDKRSCK